MKHKHAELMLQYALDAMETDTPWEWWECAFVSSEGLGRWEPLAAPTHSVPSMIFNYEYRRKADAPPVPWHLLDAYKTKAPLMKHYNADGTPSMANIDSETGNVSIGTSALRERKE